VVAALAACVPGLPVAEPWPAGVPGADGACVLVGVEPVGPAGDVVGCVWGPAAGRSASVDTVGPDEHALTMHAQANMPITGMRRVRVIVTMPDRSPLVSLGAPDSVGPSAPAARGRPLAVRLPPGATGPVGCSGRVEVRHRKFKDK
jgi:hypothetical protein